MIMQLTIVCGLFTAIVGGGIGGLSTAHFIRELFPHSNITVYEKEKVEMVY